MNERVNEKHTDPSNNLFEVIKVYVPKALSTMLRGKAKSMGLPVSRLVSYAIDNELESSAFNYPCPLPTVQYIDFAYVEEASRMYQYMTKFPSGAGRDQYMLCRFDMGIPDKNTFMLAFRELLQKEMIEERAPTRTKFKYPKDYKYVCLKNMNRIQLLDKKHESLQVEIKELERQKKKLENQLKSPHQETSDDTKDEIKDKI